jgi:ParB family chromosome partitioning protein
MKMRHDKHFVEELTTQTMGEAVGRMIPVGLIAPDPGQPRTTMGDLEELTASVESKGVLEPILVRPVNSDEAAPRGAEFVIVSGERRYRAAREAGLAEIPAIELEVDQSEALEIALVENLQRKDLTPFEEADGFGMLGDLHGYTHEEISKAVGKSRSLVTETLQLAKLRGPVRNAAEALGITTRSLLVEIAKMDGSERDKIAMLEKVASNELSRDDVRQEVRTRKPARLRRATATPRFTFRDPKKSFRILVEFKKETVEKQELIEALEQVLTELRGKA